MHEQCDSVALFASMMPTIKQTTFISSIQSSAYAYLVIAFIIGIQGQEENYKLVELINEWMISKEYKGLKTNFQAINTIVKIVRRPII